MESMPPCSPSTSTDRSLVPLVVPWPLINPPNHFRRLFFFFPFVVAQLFQPELLALGDDTHVGFPASTYCSVYTAPNTFTLRNTVIGERYCLHVWCLGSFWTEGLPAYAYIRRSNLAGEKCSSHLDFARTRAAVLRALKRKEPVFW